VVICLEQGTDLHELNIHMCMNLIQSQNEKPVWLAHISSQSAMYVCSVHSTQNNVVTHSAEPTVSS